MSGNQTLGVLLLGAPYVGLFVALWYSVGLRDAAIIMGSSAAIVASMVLGIVLLASP